MRKGFFKSFICCFLVIIIFFSIPADILAKNQRKNESYRPTEQSVVISADSVDTVVVSEKEEPDIEYTDGVIEIAVEVYKIERDYEQECMVRVTNTSDELQEFYLEAGNPYKDLSLEIIKSGSKVSPMLLQPEESAQIELSVFAQNAEKDTYKIPISSYIRKDGDYIEDTKTSVTLNCNIPKLNLEWKKVSENASTLKQKYSIKNNGDALADLSISVSDTLKDYVSFMPIVTGYGLEHGETVVFTVQPDLAKMKADHMSRLEGSLIASCAGENSRFMCVFDTKEKEITITTMGELALKQDGNPFTKFEVEEDSVDIGCYKNGTYVKAEDLTLGDFLDNNNQMDCYMSSSVDLGVEDTMDVEFSMKSYVLQDDEKSISTEPRILENKDGSIEISIKRVLTAEEYYVFLEQIASGNTAFLSAFNKSGVKSADPMDELLHRDPYQNMERFLLETTFDINSILNIGGFGSSFLGTLGDIYDINSELEECFAIAANPMINKEIKEKYYMVSIAKTAVSAITGVLGAVNPVAGFVCFAIEKSFDSLFESYKDLLLSKKGDNAYTAFYQQILGSQCTNRGSIMSSFYVPDYSTKSENKPSMYITSRLYADGYVDRENTNYDISLNSGHAMTVNTDGLTQTVITQIPVNYLKPGENNVLVFDYDTNPGSHSVSTDTRITLLYPKDTEIGYIGKPDDLQEVRTMPDFAVYPENIFAEDDLVVGEETELKFNVYNIGSCGGWFTLTVNDGARQIFKEENYYLSAFSSKTFSIKWMPIKAENEIRISLDNTSVDLNELDEKNNIAIKNMIARQRQIPDIVSLIGSPVYEDTFYSMTVDMADYQDIADVSFYIDGTKLDGMVRTSYNGMNKRYQVAASKYYAVGEHQGEVHISYAVADGMKMLSRKFTFDVLEKLIAVPKVEDCSEGTLLFYDSFQFTVADADHLVKTEIIVNGGKAIQIDPVRESVSGCMDYSINCREFGRGSHSIVIKMSYMGRNSEILTEEYKVDLIVVSEEDSYFTFELSADIASPDFYIADRYSFYEIQCEGLGNYRYRIPKTLDMVENAGDYQLVVKHDKGLVTAFFSQNNVTINMQSCRKLEFAKTGDAKEAVINQVRIVKIGDGMGSVAIDLPAADTLSFSPGRYLLSVRGNINNWYFDREIEVDLSQRDQIVNLSEFVLGYYFKMEGTENTDWEAQLYYRRKGCVYWESICANTLFDPESNMLKCFIVSSYDISKIKDAEEARMVISSDSEVYAPAVDTDGYMVSVAMEMEAGRLEGECAVLNRDSLNKVLLKCVTGDVSVLSTSVETGIYTCFLRGGIIYLPDDKYTFSVNLNLGIQNITTNIEAEIVQDCEVMVDNEVRDFMGDVRISWACQYEQEADISSYIESGEQVFVNGFMSGNNLKTKMGSQTINAALRQDSCKFFVENSIEVAGGGSDIEFGNVFKGEIIGHFEDIQQPGQYIALSIGNLKDENGNVLSGFYSDGEPLRGMVIFTDIQNEKKQFSMPVTAVSLYGIRTFLPEEAGVYKIALELYSYIKESGHKHSVVIDPVITATCTAAGLTEGSHCKSCGEVIVRQAVIEALGHQYDYIDNKDGTHNAVCRRCGNIFTEKHMGICNLCGGVWNIINVPVHEHVWNANPTVDKKATCVSEGVKSIHCVYCGVIKEGSAEAIPKTAHKWSWRTNVKNGEVIYTCAVCGKVRKESDSKLKLPKKGTKVLYAGTQYKITKSSRSKGTVEYIKTNKKVSKVVIPETINLDGITYKVTSIADNAFKGDKKISILVIGKNVTKIGKRAFYKCTNLKKLMLGSNLVSLSESAFEKCTALTSVVIPAKVTVVGNRSFCGCKKLRMITIKSKKIKKIGNNSIKGIYKKAVIKVPKSKYKLYKRLFTGKKGFGNVMTIKINR